MIAAVCLCAYMIVDPTNLKPRLIRSLLITSESGVFACLRLNSLYTSVDEPATQANQHQACWNRGARLYIMTQLNSF